MKGEIGLYNLISLLTYGVNDIVSTLINLIYSILEGANIVLIDFITVVFY